MSAIKIIFPKISSTEPALNVSCENTVQTELFTKQIIAIV